MLGLIVSVPDHCLYFYFQSANRTEHVSTGHSYLAQENA